MKDDGERIASIRAKDYFLVLDAGNAPEFLRRVESGECQDQAGVDALLRELSVPKGAGDGV